MTAVQSLGHAQNWDEDFAFQRTRPNPPIAHSPGAIASTAENWDDDFEDQTHISPRSPHTLRPFRPSTSKSNTENWDDDFEDHSQDSPNPPRVIASHSATENWDDEFASSNAPVENWDDELDGPQSSDDDFGGEKEEDRTVTARSRRLHPFNFTPPPPVPTIPTDFNLSERMQFPRSPSTSIFSLPATIGTNRPESSAGCSYNSTLGLRPTISGGHVASSARRFGGLPASPPTHRERRRLRKKSRPTHLDDALIELDDRFPDQPTTPPSQPSTPEPAEVQRPEGFGTQTPPNTNTSSNSTKAPLLSRIGSVKKWRPGRRRLSMELQDVSQDDSRRREKRSIDHDIEVTPRPPSVLAKVQQSPSGGGKESNGRFFRISGSVGGNQLKSEKSAERIGLGPSPAMNRRRKKSSREPSPSPSPLYGITRRPSSMMISANGGSGKPRHASSGAIPGASTSRTSFSASVEDLTYRLVNSVSRDRMGKGKDRDENGEGRRNFMGGPRKVSFGGSAIPDSNPEGGGIDSDGVKKKVKEQDKDRRHKKNKSSISIDIRAVDNGNTSIIADEPPQIPDFAIAGFPLSPIFPLPVESPDQQKSSNALLPALELEPTNRVLLTSSSEPAGLVHTILNPEVAKSPISSVANKLNLSPKQSASLGRSTQPPKNVDPSTLSGGKVVRRNSLSDLKIPMRISQAQIGLKRDLGMVKEFASSVEQLKELRVTYSSLVLEMQSILSNTRTRPSTPAPPSRPTSPTTLLHGRRRSRSSATAMPRSTAHTQLSNALQEIESKYMITWECAELLIELGGGAAVASTSISKVPSQASLASDRLPSSSSAPPDLSSSRRNRERAITLAGNEPKPPISSDHNAPSVAKTSRNSNEWKTAGRHDLSHRQLVLLKEMLTSPEPNPSNIDALPFAIDRLQLPEGESVNRQWRWGADPGGSTITLPPSEVSAPGVQGAGAEKNSTKKRRTGRLGMSAVLDMLRSLKRSVIEQQGQGQRHPPSSESSVAFSEHGYGRRRAKTSTGPESVRDGESPLPDNRNPRSPYGTSVSVNKSPRRPSLASIFRFSKNKSSANSTASGDRSVERFRNTPPASSSGGTESQGSQATTEDEEDWDQMEDSTSDLDFHSPRIPLSSDGSATLRPKGLAGKGEKKSPYMLHQEELPPEHATLRRGPEASRSSIWEGTWSRGTKLSNVEETAENQTPSRSESKKTITQVFGLSPSVSLRRQQPPLGSKRLSVVPTAPLLAVQRSGKSASLRSAPAQLTERGLGPNETLPDPKLALTPENIKPLLENAQEVQLRCNECVGEMKLLLSLGEAART